MAYRISQYQENFTTSSTVYTTVVGVQVPFQGLAPSSSLYGSDAVFNVNYTSKDQIKSNIINFLLTDQGERIFNPNFGSNLRRYLFSNLTEDGYVFKEKIFPDGRRGQYTNIGLKDLEINIKNDLSANFPMVVFNSVSISPNYDNNQASINISYSFVPNIDEFIEIEM